MGKSCDSLVIGDAWVNLVTVLSVIISVEFCALLVINTQAKSDLECKRQHYNLGIAIVYTKWQGKHCKFENSKAKIYYVRNDYNSIFCCKPKAKCIKRLKKEKYK